MQVCYYIYSFYFILFEYIHCTVNIEQVRDYIGFNRIGIVTGDGMLYVSYCLLLINYIYVATSSI